MGELGGPEVNLDKPVRRRSTGALFGDLGARVVRALGGVEPTKASVPTLAPSGEPGDGDRGSAPSGEPFASRFGLAWRGYDRVSVDEYVGEVERDLAALLARPPAGSLVVEELERIGDQTSAILRVAHEQAEAETRRARTEAERCLAEAQSEASAIVDAAKRQLGVLDSETDSVWRERARLIADAREVASGLLSLAQGAAERFPAEPEKPEQSDPAAIAPGRELANGRASSEPPPA